MTKKSSRKIAVVPGDGIGIEVIDAGTRVLNALNSQHELGLELVEKDWGAERWLKEGVGLPKGSLEELEAEYDAVFFGALGDPRVPDMAHGREILLGMRQGLDLYANVRPIKVMDERYCPLKNKGPDEVDFVVIRENTEDLYVSLGGNFKQGTPDEVAIDESMNTRKGVERIIRFAFEYAVSNGRKKVMLSDKHNAIRFGGGLWKRTFDEVASEYSLETDHLFVDVAAMEMVRSPERFDVVVTNNLFGDILSDLGAGLIGSLGLAASGNVHPGKIGLFEPVHGSAPDIVGQGIANPLATFMTASMMLRFLDAEPAALVLEKAIQGCVAEGIVTPDLGGKHKSEDITRFVLDALAS